jgi:hypothetical protein
MLEKEIIRNKGFALEILSGFGSQESRNAEARTGQGGNGLAGADVEAFFVVRIYGSR